MPFDSSDNTALRRAVLVAALRGEMPDGFKWDFGIVLYVSECGTAGCAIGLAQVIGLVSDAWDEEEVAAQFGMTSEQVYKVFFGPYKEGYPTPAMVADRLEAL
jgi:hypothetical protein